MRCSVVIPYARLSHAHHVKVIRGRRGVQHVGVLREGAHVCQAHLHAHIPSCFNDVAITLRAARVGQHLIAPGMRNRAVRQRFVVTLVLIPKAPRRLHFITEHGAESEHPPVPVHDLLVHLDGRRKDLSSSM